ncbi:EAL domain-containing protein [Deinococcus multiflagellatus]|uniref:EAL domain-containing protein n=1 Tax=Deinococcus multiflagellatus TaxID=1656887 RepID=UPI001CCD19DB|nr:EAL domain-containing protein [Deinococcus multiflagellatus]MBZ9711868.1 EAL domain-containing protein [Deinococcus multiflagellatus]
MSVSTHACDCLAAAPPVGEVASGLWVRGQTRYVQRFLGGQEARLFPASAVAELRALLAQAGPSGQAELLATPALATGEPDAWQVRPLAEWLVCLETPWYPDALQHLTFDVQPIVALGSGTVGAYEALVRAQLGERRVGAGELLRAAEGHRHLRSFDAQARREAIRQAAPLLPAGQQLFINFAPGVVYNPDVCLQTTFAACREADIDFQCLVFEVTESERFPDLDMLRRILARYRAEGARVALDDLGAGYTSLSYLDELRPDIVKLDRALSQNLTPNDPRVGLLAALIAYAHDLEIQVVAEGVEDLDSLRLLRELGADYAQGYVLGRPAPTLLPIREEAAALWSTKT